MYVLTGKAVHYLIPGAVYTVGRKTDCDVVIIADANYGISRTHGQIACHTNGEVLYTDLSQFGTYVDNTKVGNKNTVPLTNGTTLRFGHDPVLWKVEELLVTASGLTGATISEVQQALKSVGIKYTSRWNSSCTTVIMSDISTTEKVICAVANCRWILMPQFVNILTECIRQRTKLPSSLRSFLPPINDTSLKSVTFKPLHKRRSLFNGLVFIFMTEKDLKQSDEVVTCCGGVSRFLDPLNPDRRSIILSEVSVVMKSSDQALESYVTGLLVERNLRPTKHSDVVMAMFYVDRNRVFRNTREGGASQLLIKQTQALTYSDTQTQRLNTQPQVSAELSEVKREPVEVSENHNLDKSAYEPSVSFQKLSCSMETSHLNEQTINHNKRKPSLDDRCKFKEKRKENTSKNGSSLFTKHIKKDTKLESNLQSNTVSAIEPSAIPPILDGTTSSFSVSSKKDDSRIKKPHLTSESLLNNRKKPQDSLFATPKTTLDLFGKTPTSKRIEASDVSLFSSDCDTPVSIRKGILPSPSNLCASGQNSLSSQKRSLFEDDDDDCHNSSQDNPFQKKSTLPLGKMFNLPVKRQRKEPIVKQESEELYPANPCTCEVVIPEEKRKNDIFEQVSPKSDTESLKETKSKRELHEKDESLAKKPRTSFDVNEEVMKPRTSFDVNEEVKKVTAGMNQWLTLPKSEPVADEESFMKTLIRTELSSSLLIDKKKPPLKPKNDITNTDVPNFKMFRKKERKTRTMLISLTVSEFTYNKEAAFLDSQPSQVGYSPVETSNVPEKNVFSRRKH